MAYISSRNNPPVEVVSQHLPGERYTFYDPGNCKQCEMLKDVVCDADTIIIWDPSFGSGNDYLFFNWIKKNGVNIEILTSYDRDHQYDNETIIIAYVDAVKKVLEKNLENYKLRVRAFKYRNPNKYFPENVLWHDRYMFVKDEVYLVGTSISGIVAGNKAFGCYHIEHQKDKTLILEQYKKMRDKLNSSNGYTVSRSR